MTARAFPAVLVGASLAALPACARDESAPSARWWIGEAYDRQRDWRQARVEFPRVADASPKSPQVADALPRIARGHEARGDAARRGRRRRERAAAPRARTLLAERGAPRIAR